MGFTSAIGTLAFHSMRAYLLAVAGGLALVTSAFVPWAFIGETPLGGWPDLASLWVLGLGLLAVVFAILSILTRKNSRHPLLLIGLTAFAIIFLAEKLMRRTASERAWAASQAVAIVDGSSAPAEPSTRTAAGTYVGLSGATLLILFGLTMVVKRVTRPYAEPEDDV